MRTYLRHRISQLLEHHFDEVGGQPKQVDRDAALNLWSLLVSVCSDASVYPYISSDGEAGVSATWRAEGDVIQLVADVDGEIWSLTRSGGGEPNVRQIDMDRRLQVVDLRKKIAKFSKKVSYLNPRWRDNFIDF